MKLPHLVMTIILLLISSAYLFCSESDNDSLVYSSGSAQSNSYNNAEKAIRHYQQLSRPLLFNYDNTSDLPRLQNSKNKMVDAFYELPTNDRNKLVAKYPDMQQYITNQNRAYANVMQAISLHKAMNTQLSQNYSNNKKDTLELASLKSNMIQAYNNLPHSMQTHLASFQSEHYAHYEEFIA